MESVVVDVDGHVAEPITEIMDQYLDPAFKDRPLRLLNDENGLDTLKSTARSRASSKAAPGLGVDAAKHSVPRITKPSSHPAPSITTTA